MSQEQERLVWRALGLVNDGDVEGIVAMTPPEAEYELIGGFEDLVGESTLRGPEGMRRFYTDWFATFTTTRVDPTAFLETGDRLLVLSCVSVTAEGTDKPVQMNIGQIYSFEGGLISRVASYYDVAAALQAAGLTERDVRNAPAVTSPLAAS
jgi:ketosteroid isomerase-like protein